MKDVMLDLETFGTSSNAVIVRIGACYFDRFTGKIGERFFEKIDPQSCVDAGFEMDIPTVLWWMRQEAPARLAVASNDDCFLIGGVLIDFKHFLRDVESIWSHATFDFVILMNYFRKFKIRVNFDYHAARDLRTLTDLAEIDPLDFPREGIKHDALSDCMFQVGYATACFNRLRREDI